MNIKKGDNVIVLTGKDKGKTGKVATAFPREQKVLILGVNVKKDHQRAKKSGEKGQVVDKPMPVHVSNVALVDSKTNKATRVGFKKEGDKKIRIAKKSGTII